MKGCNHMSKKLTQEESLLLQSLATTSLLAELSNDNFLSKSYFSQLKFNNDTLKDILKLSGIGNPACLQMMLYALLVLPKELLNENIYPSLNSDFAHINQKMQNLVIKSDTNTTYTKDFEYAKNCKSKYSITCDMNYLRHIRNAVSHANCYYNSESEKHFVTFKDSNGYEECSIKIECYKVGIILEDLQNLIFNFFK